MKLLKFVIVMFLGFGCKSQAPHVECYKNTEQKEISNEYSDIALDIVYNSDCKIAKISTMTKLDARSGEVNSIENIKHISTKLGAFNDTIFSRTIDIDSVEFNNKKELVFDVLFPSPFLDTLDLMHLDILIKKPDGKRLKSMPYFYNETASIFDVNSTYLDYKAFTNTDVITKVLSHNGNIIEEVRITIKVKQVIDDIRGVKISLNGLPELTFKSSILAEFDDIELVSDGCTLENMLKVHPEYLQLDLNVSNKKINKISSISVKLNNQIYQ